MTSKYKIVKLKNLDELFNILTKKGDEILCKDKCLYYNTKPSDDEIKSIIFELNKLNIECKYYNNILNPSICRIDESIEGRFKTDWYLIKKVETIIKMCNFCQEKFEDKDLQKLNLQPNKEQFFIEINLCKECYEEICTQKQVSYSIEYKSE